MKNLFSLLLFVVVCTTASSQVGINTIEPDDSAILDISSNNKGVLFPRMDLGNLNEAGPVTNPTKGLTVWNTSTGSEGLYYWNGSSWAKLSVAGGSSSNNEWQLRGNTITDGDFLGTTNQLPLVLKVNQTQVGRFHHRLGAMALGFNAIASEERGIAIGNASLSQGNDAISIGSNAKAPFQSIALGLNAESVGNNAIAIGLGSKANYRAISIGESADATANDAIAIGRSSKTSSLNNIAIGLNATTSGNDAIAIGTASTTSSQNTIAIGNNARVSGQNSTAIGWNSSATQPNTVILGRTDDNSFKIGIGTDNPTEKLQVNGKVKIVDGTQGAGKVLTSDANGVGSWVARSYAEIKLTNDVSFPNNGANLKISGTSSKTPATATAITNTNFSFRSTAGGFFKLTYTITFKLDNKVGKNGDETVEFSIFKEDVSSVVAGSEIRETLSENYETISVTKILNLEANKDYSLRVTNNSGETLRIYSKQTNIVLEAL